MELTWSDTNEFADETVFLSVEWYDTDLHLWIPIVARQAAGAPDVPMGAGGTSAYANQFEGGASMS